MSKVFRKILSLIECCKEGNNYQREVQVIPVNDDGDGSDQQDLHDPQGSRSEYSQLVLHFSHLKV